MGSKETRLIPKHACTGRLVIVALSAQPPGVNEFCVCVCVCVCVCTQRRGLILVKASLVYCKLSGGH